MSVAVRLFPVLALAPVSALAQPAAPPASEAANANNEDGKPVTPKPKLVCKRVPVAGSNVGTERICSVKRETAPGSQKGKL